MKESKIEILPIDAGLNPEALLSDYYQSLNCYHPAKDTESVEAPLWQLRLLHLQQQYHLTEQLKEAAETCQKPELRLLLNLTYLAAKEVDNSSKCFSFSSLSPEEKIQLLNMADADNSLRQPYAISLLMTLFLRDSNKQYRQIGLKLLKKGKYNDDSFEIGNSQPLKVNLKLSSHTDLCRSPFIDFSYSNFMALGEIKINLSGQYLKGIKAERVIFSAVHGGHFRFACLEEAVLIHAIIKKCDFTGAVLYKADFSHANIKESIFNQVNADQINLISAKAKGSQWEQANLYGAKLDAANLTQANLHRSDITGVVFEQSILKKTVLTEVTGLNAVSLQKAEQFEKCKVSLNSLSHTDQQTLQEKSINTMILAATQFVAPERIEFLASDLLKGESLSYQEESPLWLRAPNRWEYQSDWHGDNTEATLCDLMPEDEIYKLIEQFVYATSDNMSYASKRFEIARLKKAAEGGKLTDFVRQELKQPPSHQGRKGSIKIHAIQLNRNPASWKKYQKRKAEILKELEQKNISQPLLNIDWHRGNQVSTLPVLNAKAGEGWFFHGTSPSVAPKITQNGFTTRFITKKPGVGYGAMGKGIYVTDAFPKGATYVVCPVCTQNQCQCPLEKRQHYKDKQEVKMIFMTRVVLGRPYIDKYKNRREEEALPEGYHSCWGPTQEKHHDSLFVCNEFMVPDETQIYPEFCIFYTDNHPALEEKNTLHLKLEKLPPQAHHFYWAMDYYQHERWAQTIEILQMAFESFPEHDQVMALIMQGIAYAHLNQRHDMLNILNQVWLIDEGQLREHTAQPHLKFKLQHYYEQSLLALQEGYEEEDQEEQFIFCQRIAAWAATQLYQGVWTSETWEQHYWDLLNAEQRQIFREALYPLLVQENISPALTAFIENLPDEQGNRLSTQKRKETFHQNLFDLLQTTESEVSIRWLSYLSDGQYVIQEGYLSSNFVQILFQQDGYPHPNDREPEGRSLVKCLKKNMGEAIAYLKFYPHYPLRQYAIDSLCARLSGYSAQTTIAWLKHASHHTAYPALLSMPLGNTILQHQKQGCDTDYENQLDAYAFTWKLFETLLIRTKDDKNDNVVFMSIFPEGSTYALVSLDTDDSFVLNTADKENVYLYSITLLMSQMDKPLHKTAMLNFLKRDWKGLLEQWLSELEHYTDLLIGEGDAYLFHEKELRDYKRLRESMVTFASRQFRGQGYNVACDLESLFRENDLKILYQSIQRIKMALAEFISQETPPHWTLVEYIDLNLYQHYQDAYQKANSASTRFQQLPYLETHFTCKAISVSSEENHQETIIISQSRQPPKIPVLGTLFAKTENPLQSYKNLSKQINNLDKLDYYYCHIIKLFEGLQEKQQIDFLKNPDFTDSMKEKVINQLQWDKLNLDFIKSLLSSCEIIAFQNLKLRRIASLTASQLRKILFCSQQLRELQISNCPSLDISIIKDFAKHPYLNKLYIQTMPWMKFLSGDVKFRQLKALYISDCDQLFHCRIKGYHLTQLVIKRCASLISVKITAPNLKQLIIEVDNLNQTQIYLNEQNIDPAILLKVNQLKMANHELILNEVCVAFQAGEIDLFVALFLALVDAVLKNKVLESVLKDLDFVQIYKNKQPEILKIILKCRGLKVLSLKNCQLVTYEILEKLLKKNKNIEILNLNGCHNLTGNIGLLLIEYQKLQFIDISSTGIASIAELASFGYLGLPKLEHLVANNLPNLGVVQLNKVTSLRILELRNCPELMELTCDSLRLEMLNIKNNAKLLDLIIVSISLKEINLAGCSSLLPDDFSIHNSLVTILAKQKDLRVAKVSERVVSENSKRVRIHLLSFTQSIILDNDWIKALSFEKLQKEKKGNQSNIILMLTLLETKASLLSELNLSCCKILTDDWFERILSKTDKNKLKIIRIGHCPLTTVRCWEVIALYAPQIEELYAQGNTQWNRTNAPNGKRKLEYLKILNLEGINIRKRFLPSVQASLEKLKSIQFSDKSAIEIFNLRRKFIQEFFMSENLTIENFEKSLMQIINEPVKLKMTACGVLDAGITSIVRKYASVKFLDNYNIGIGHNFASKIIDIGEHKIHLQLWDIASREGYSSMIRIYVKDSSAGLLCIPIDRIFSDVDNIIKCARYMEQQIAFYGHKLIPKLLLITKNDMARNLKIKYYQYLSQIYFLVKATGSVGYQICSATENYGINEAFEKATQLGLFYQLQTEPVLLSLYQSLCNHYHKSIYKLLQDNQIDLMFQPFVSNCLVIQCIYEVNTPDFPIYELIFDYGMMSVLNNKQYMERTAHFYLAKVSDKEELFEKVEELKIAGIEMHIVESQRMTPFYFAIWSEEAKTVSLLLEKLGNSAKAYITDTLQALAALNLDPEVVNCLACYAEKDDCSSALSYSQSSLISNFGILNTHSAYQELSLNEQNPPVIMEVNQENSAKVFFNGKQN